MKLIKYIWKSTVHWEYMTEEIVRKEKSNKGAMIIHSAEIEK